MNPDNAQPKPIAPVAPAGGAPAAPAMPAAPVAPATPPAPPAGPAAHAIPAGGKKIQVNSDGSYDPNLVNPDAFKERILAKYPDGVAKDGTKYADMDAADLTQKISQAYPHGMTEDGVPYVAFTDPGAKGGQTDALAGHPILKGVTDFLGMSGLSKGLTQAIYLNFTKDGQQLSSDLKSGKISYDDFNNAIGGLAKPNEVIGSAMQTASDVAIPSEAGSWVQQALKWAGVGALSGAGSAIEQGKSPAPTPAHLSACEPMNPLRWYGNVNAVCMTIRSGPRLSVSQDRRSRY